MLNEEVMKRIMQTQQVAIEVIGEELANIKKDINKLRMDVNNKWG